MNEQNLNDIATEPQNEENPAEQKPKKKATFLSEFFDYFELFIISACAVLMLFSVATRLCRVDGPSMLNTLHDGEMLIVSDLFYTPKRGDIIVFHQTGDNPGDLNEPIVKRVIATEGEWIGIVKNSSGTLTVTIYDENKENPRVIDEAYANYDKGVGYYNYTGEPVQVPEGCLFVMGDNRGNSQDSRADTIGFVDCRRVLGKVICRLTPLDKFGFVN
ncbi:MAG: signal peptidase I [Eubacteriales bacterium]